MDADYGYIVTTYRVEQAGQPIDECQVVRATNGRFFGRDEPARFRVLSSASCPTYGNCTSCWRSGPLNMQCIYCNNDGKVYSYLWLSHGGGVRILDAEYFAHLMGRGDDHVVALADRRYNWIRDHSLHVTTDLVRIIMPRWRRDDVNSLLWDEDPEE
jgi:hypothetical protein